MLSITNLLRLNHMRKRFFYQDVWRLDGAHLIRPYSHRLVEPLIRTNTTKAFWPWYCAVDHLENPGPLRDLDYAGDTGDRNLDNGLSWYGPEGMNIKLATQCGGWLSKPQLWR
ncbi:uncharacterized protein LAJ45_06319 [Morchella importuna]|uniref:uncharacterized protein n=1 Tax=Morchella importuna TaxID=1174673 RepID=UPI001E8D0B5B|nr:uncharacterized protein LAJ45_06319 [Morchella importuna]KAH8149688.1 hypothetical protein LAJ45_06319 [Morchella importuna]